MTPAHALCEVLAGAIALGEATPAERETFSAHALACGACRHDAAFLPAAAALLDEARARECWRPAIDNVVLGRIRDARRKHSSLAFGALGWAVAASIVLNVAFASGFAAHAARAFADRRDVETIARTTPVLLEERRTRVAPAVRARRAWLVPNSTARHAAASRAAAPNPAALHAATRRSAAVAARQAVPPAVSAARALPPPDALAGFDLAADSEAVRTVALEGIAGCDAAPPELHDDAPCGTWTLRPPR